MKSKVVIFTPEGQLQLREPYRDITQTAFPEIAAVYRGDRVVLRKSEDLSAVERREIRL